MQCRRISEKELQSSLVIVPCVSPALNALRWRCTHTCVRAGHGAGRPVGGRARKRAAATRAAPCHPTCCRRHAGTDHIISYSKSTAAVKSCDVVLMLSPLAATHRCDDAQMQAMLGMGFEMEKLLNLGHPETAYPTEPAHACTGDRMRAMSAALIEAACLILTEGAHQNLTGPVQHDADAGSAVNYEH